MTFDSDAERWYPEYRRCPTCGKPLYTHVCLSCSPDRQTPGPGCADCGYTRMDQTPCQQPVTGQPTTDDRWHLAKTVTPRGFTHLPGIPSEYGGHIRVSESSAASGPHIWVRATAPVDLSQPDGPMREVVTLLTVDNAQRLVEQLQATIRDHYQLRG